MTREEHAIDIIESECYIFNPCDLDRTIRVNTALDMAVKALKQEPEYLSKIPEDYTYDTETEDFFVYRHKYTGNEIHIEKPIPTYSFEPCWDAISRKDFIAKIEDIYDGYMLDEGGCYPQHFVDLAEEMPSVTPQYTEAEIQKIQELEQAQLEKAYEIGKAEQQRVGRWERTEYSPGLCNYHCSECHNISLDIGNYCPNCGAKMESE